ASIGGLRRVRGVFGFSSRERVLPGHAPPTRCTIIGAVSSKTPTSTSFGEQETDFAEALPALEVRV
ncbi:MAG: hypothetical protein AVDCRST_MAG02-3159, partial [uncultured Rubrobacteraceae bacterium]